MGLPTDLCRWAVRGFFALTLSYLLAVEVFRLKSEVFRLKLEVFRLKSEVN